MYEDGSKVTDNSKYSPIRISMFPIFGMFLKANTLVNKSLILSRLLYRVKFTGASDALNLRIWVEFDSKHFTAQNVRNGENW